MTKFGAAYDNKKPIAAFPGPARTLEFPAKLDNTFIDHGGQVYEYLESYLPWLELGGVGMDTFILINPRRLSGTSVSVWDNRSYVSGLFSTDIHVIARFWVGIDMGEIKGKFGRRNIEKVELLLQYFDFDAGQFTWDEKINYGVTNSWDALQSVTLDLDLTAPGDAKYFKKDMFGNKLFAKTRTVIRVHERKPGEPIVKHDFKTSDEVIIGTTPQFLDGPK